MLIEELTTGGAAASDASVQDVLTRIAGLVPVFAARAVGADRTSTFPVDNLADLRAAGLLALQVPTGQGGRGLDAAAYCAAMAVMAAGDAATAIACNMHAAALLSLACLARPEQRQRWFDRVTEGGAIIAALGSEPGLKPFVDAALPRTRLIRTGRGFRLSGLKSYCSFGPHADYLYIAAALDDGVAFAIVEGHAPGISRDADWDVTAMRATESVTTRFDDVAVAAEDVIQPADHRAALLLEVEFALGYGPIYLGAACAAADRAIGDNLARTGPGSPDEAALARLAGEMIALARPAWLTCLDAARTGQPGDLARARAIVLAKAVGAEAACAIATRALRLRGGRGLVFDDPVGRAFRDVQAGQVMAFSPELARDMLGFIALGRPPAHIRALLEGGAPAPAEPA